MIQPARKRDPTSIVWHPVVSNHIVYVRHSYAFCSDVLQAYKYDIPTMVVCYYHQVGTALTLRQASDKVYRDFLLDAFGN
jgi:hypothetical protein